MHLICCVWIATEHDSTRVEDMNSNYALRYGWTDTLERRKCAANVKKVLKCHHLFHFTCKWISAWSRLLKWKWKIIIIISPSLSCAGESLRWKFTMLRSHIRTEYASDLDKCAAYVFYLMSKQKYTYEKNNNNNRDEYKNNRETVPTK